MDQDLIFKIIGELYARNYILNNQLVLANEEIAKLAKLVEALRNGREGT